MKTSCPSLEIQTDLQAFWRKNSYRRARKGSYEYCNYPSLSESVSCPPLWPLCKSLACSVTLLLATSSACKSISMLLKKKRRGGGKKRFGKYGAFNCKIKWVLYLIKYSQNSVHHWLVLNLADKEKWANKQAELSCYKQNI